VHVNFINEEASPGLKRGGTLNIVHHTLDLTVAADNIPEEVVVDLTGLDIGDSIHISQITLPAGATDHSHEEDVTIATIVAPSALKSAGTDDAGEAQAE
jgi:large subunit ribosomal protein L25